MKPQVSSPRCQRAPVTNCAVPTLSLTPSLGRGFKATWPRVVGSANRSPTVQTKAEAIAPAQAAHCNQAPVKTNRKGACSVKTDGPLQLNCLFADEQDSVLGCFFFFFFLQINLKQKKKKSIFQTGHGCCYNIRAITTCTDLQEINPKSLHGLGKGSQSSPLSEELLLTASCSS